jgi:serine/threonine-protein kinase
MTLEPGQQLLHYRLVKKIGEGGMGEVYQATDTKLNRDVALKILPEQFSAGAERMARFQREAEVLASLDHPNIGAIHGIEDIGETKALVLQLIEFDPHR